MEETTILTVEAYDKAVADIAEMKVGADKAIARGDALKRLESNDDYILVIKNGYQKAYSVEIAEAISSNTGGYDEDALIEDLKAIKGLIPYLIGIVNSADAGAQSLVANDAYLANVEVV